jgi:tripartite-type tricarboxylate transporter receptor subunit TctC
MGVNWLFVPCLTIALSVSAATGATAQDYPTRQVTIMVPFTPGGGTDILARLFASKLEQRLGKPFIVENRPGAGMQIGTNAVAKSEPDGHTLLVAPSSAIAANVTLYKKLAYDPVTELAPLALLAHIPFVLVVNNDLPIHSINDLIKLAKEKPGQLTFGSGGVGATHHLFGELLNSLAGIKTTHVPYKGTVPALTDVTAGHISFLFSDVPPALPLIRAGKVRAVGVSTAKRLPATPEIPPISEQLPEFTVAAWQMLLTRAGTPAPVIDRLHKEASAIIATPEVQKQFVDQGMISADPASPAELQRYVKSEIERWGKLVRQAGAAGLE